MLKRTSFYVAWLMLPFVVISQNPKTTQNTPINAKSSFGRLGSDCSGRGVCSFNIDSNKAQVNSQLIYNEDYTLTLIIDRNKITKEEEVKIVGEILTETSKVNEITFLMEDELVLKDETKTTLKITNQLTKIAKGNYSALITKNTITLTLILE